MTRHSDREHAQWSASATARNWQCSGALALTDHLPETTNEAADWGTCCHQISEACLRDGSDAERFIGTTQKGKQHEFEVDDEMAETAQDFIDYVRGRMGKYESDTGDTAELIVEQKFSLETLNPPFEAGGTGDAVLIFKQWKLIEVVDLKGGRGVVVEAEGNPQLRTYGLGTLLENSSIDIDMVKVTIVQPRAAHKDGRIRSEDMHIVDLLEWTADLMEAMQRAVLASADYEKIGGAMTETQWSVAHLKAGAHCKFCKAAATCLAREREVMDQVGVWFDELDQPQIANTPDRLSPDELANRLDMLEMIEDWCKAVRAHAHKQAEDGIIVPRYQLVQKTGREKWLPSKEAEAVKLAKAAGVDDDKIWNARKMRTPKQVREALKKAKATKALEAIKAFSETPISGTNLVNAEKSIRQAVKPAVEQHFNILD